MGDQRARRRCAGGLVVAALTLAACGDSAGPSPSASAAATAPRPASLSTAATPARLSGSLQPRPTDTGARLVRMVTARAEDASGKPVGESAVFDTQTDRRIVLAIELAAATRATTVTYRRYIEGAFVDAKTAHPKQDGDGFITFSWLKTAPATYPVGAYSVDVYLDGVKRGSLGFAVH